MNTTKKFISEDVNLFSGMGYIEILKQRDAFLQKQKKEMDDLGKNLLNRNGINTDFLSLPVDEAKTHFESLGYSLSVKEKHIFENDDIEIFIYLYKNDDLKHPIDSISFKRKQIRIWH